MDQFKQWYASRAVWSNIIGVIALLAYIFGIPGVASAADMGHIVENILAIVSAGGSLLAIYYRINATSQIGSPNTITIPAGTVDINIKFDDK